MRYSVFAVLLAWQATWCVAVGGEENARAPRSEASGRDVASEPLTSEAEAAVKKLRAELPPDSEAILMLEDILAGSRMQADSGWFAVAKAQTRYPWAEVVRRFDRDGDQRVTANEFSGSAEDFTRLDATGDQQLTEEDFVWNEPSTKRTPGMMLFLEADQDGNGKVTAEEFNKLFQRYDAGEHGFLALDDLATSFAPPSPRELEQRADRPSRSTLVLGLLRQEIGSLQPGPNVGEHAPNFTLESLDGKTVTLADEIGDKPVVLIFGNFTCGPFRSQAGNIEKLYERYRDRAKFFLVYVREAHPTDGWWMNSNRRVGVEVAQPRTNAERREVAATCQQHLNLDLPFLVDTTDDAVGARYSGMPNRLYLIDREGEIAFKSGRGPFGFRPRQLEQALVLLMADEAARTSQ